VLGGWSKAASYHPARVRAHLAAPFSLVHFLLLSSSSPDMRTTIDFGRRGCGRENHRVIAESPDPEDQEDEEAAREVIDEPEGRQPPQVKGTNGLTRTGTVWRQPTGCQNRSLRA